MTTTKPPANPIRIVIVDDHPLVRERLVELISREPDLVVAGEAEDRQESLRIIETVQPHLAIIDLSLKNSLGIELIKDLQYRNPEVLILVVSMQDEMIHAERCIRAGARGYITKQEASRHVMLAIRRVLSGEIYLSSAVASQVLSRSLGHKSDTDVSSAVSLLTDRELQVFELTGKGHNTRQIAEFLQLEVKTVETYRARIKEKLSLKDGTELLQRAIHWVHQPPES